MPGMPVVADGERSPADTPLQIPDTGAHVALYAFHPFTAAELSEIARTCDDTGEVLHPYTLAQLSEVVRARMIEDHYIHPAPNPHFLAANATIENVVTYHRALTSPPRYDDFFDPSYLVIAKSSNWKTEGVLTVILNKFDLDTIPDDGEAFRRGWDSWMFKPASVGSIFANLQIGNMDWTDFTAWSEIQPEGHEVDKRDGNVLLQLQLEEETADTQLEGGIEHDS